MPKGYPKDPQKSKRSHSISEVAKQAAPIKQVTDDISDTPQLQSAAASKPALADSCSRLLTADIDIPTVQAAALDEGLAATTAYASKRIGDLSKQEILAKSLRIRQIARQKGYKLDMLVHDPEQLQAALDDYDLTCFELGLYPLQNLLAVWLSTTAAQLVALTSAANVSEAGQMLATHSDYCISVIASSAMCSDKPPLFSIYYLKTAYKMYDQKNDTNLGNLSLFSGSVTQNISINAADISKNSQLFSEIDTKNVAD